MNIIIRDEREADIPAITDVIAAAFLHAEHTSHTEQFVVTALRNAGVLTVSKVAESDGKIVGHVAVSPVEISDGSERWFGLGPISVLPEYQKLGVGSKLMYAALDTLRQKNARGCVLLGDPNYYYRFGFAADSRLVLPDVPSEYFQALLMAGDFPVGVVTYHDGFNAVS